MAISEADVAVLRSVLTALHTPPRYDPELGDPDVVIGCPPAAVFSRPPPQAEGQFHNLRSDTAVGIRHPDLPSRWPFGYFVPPEVFHDYFGGAPFFTAVAEMRCSGHTCAEATRSLYLSAGSDASSVRTALENLLGIPDFSVCSDDPPSRSRYSRRSPAQGWQRASWSIMAPQTAPITLRARRSAMMGALSRSSAVKLERPSGRRPR